MGNIDKKQMAKVKSFHICGCSFFVHPSPEIMTKHNTKETDSKGNIWGPFYMSKDEVWGGG